MIKNILRIGLMAMVFGLIPAIVPAQAEAAATNVNLTTVESATTQGRYFGPYATLRRANEVANYARYYGYKAKIIYNGSYIYGTRTYSVYVWR